MRALWWLVMVGCGSNPAHSPDAVDAPACDAPPPAAAMIAGGGITDGPLACGVNVYVVDDTTRQPIANALIGVGAMTGTTDASGLFTQRGVSGPQTIYVKATGYASAVWFGVDGGNVTIELIAPFERLPSARVSGTVIGLDSVVVLPSHMKYVSLASSIDDHLDDARNYAPQPADAKYGCEPAAGTCDFSFEVRAGTIALAAVIEDYNPNDGTLAPVAWADHLDLHVVDGVDQTGVDLTVIDQNSYVTETIDFGTTPFGLPAAAHPGIDLGVDGTLLLVQVNSTSPTLLMPALSLFPGASYTLDASASDGDRAYSRVKRRGFTGSTLSAGSWLAPPMSSSISVETETWLTAPDARIQGADFSNAAGRLMVMAFDGRTSVDIPSAVAIADAQGQLFVTGGDFDPKNFGFERDRLAMTTDAEQLSYIPPSSTSQRDAGIDAAP